MKRLLNIFLVLSFLIALSSFAFAAEKIVQLEVPGCRPCGTAARINKIMKNIDGVKKYENTGRKGHELLIVMFDDEKTTIKKIIHELEKGGFTVNDKPAHLK